MGSPEHHQEELGQGRGGEVSTIRVSEWLRKTSLVREGMPLTYPLTRMVLTLPFASVHDFRRIQNPIQLIFVFRKFPGIRRQNHGYELCISRKGPVGLPL